MMWCTGRAVASLNPAVELWRLKQCWANKGEMCGQYGMNKCFGVWRKAVRACWMIWKFYIIISENNVLTPTNCHENSAHHLYNIVFLLNIQFNFKVKSFSTNFRRKTYSERHYRLVEFFQYILVTKVMSYNLFSLFEQLIIECITTTRAISLCKSLCTTLNDWRRCTTLGANI